MLRAQVIEHRRMRSICTCGAVHGGAFPIDVTAPVQYGGRLKAVWVNLNQQQFVLLLRYQRIHGLYLWRGGFRDQRAAFTHKAAKALQPGYQQMGRTVQAAP